jgi:ribosomal protein L7/L12
MSKCQFCKMDIARGASSCPSCGAAVPTSGPASLDLEQRARSLLAQGRKLEAVRIYKNEVGCSLKEAKDAVEALERGDGPPQPTEADASLEADILRLLRDGERIRAAKLHKERTGASLREAKQAIESIATRHGIAVPDAGCSGVVIFLIVIVVAAMAVVAALILAQ